MSYTLRPYQEKFVNDIADLLAEENINKVCATLPTGGGKTITSAALIDFYLQHNLRILFCVNREELVNQSKDKFKQFSDKISIIKAGKEYKYLFNVFQPVQIVMQQTWFARRKKLPALNPDLIIVDEAHEGHMAQRLQTLRETYPNAKYLGITATPIDEKGYLLTGFDKIIQNLQVPDLQKLGYLCDDIVFNPVDVDLSKVKITAGDYNEHELSEEVSKDFIVDNVVENYRKIAHDRKTIAFCVDIAHAKKMNKAFLEAGYRSEVVHSQLENLADKRKDILQKLKNGELDILFNVGILTTGFDEPSVNCILLLRPTKSLRLYIQMCGRGLRISEGKENCLFLDCANLVKKENYGAPSEYRIYPKKGEKEKQQDDKDKRKLCPECDCLNAITATHCKDCGYRFPVAVRTKDCEICGCCNPSNAANCKNCGYPFESKKEKEVKIVDLKEYEKIIYSREKVLEALQKYCIKSGYKEGVAKYLLRDIEEFKPEDWPDELFYKFVFSYIKKAKSKGYKPYWIKFKVQDYFKPEELYENAEEKTDAINNFVPF